MDVLTQNAFVKLASITFLKNMEENLTDGINIFPKLVFKSFRLA